MLTCGTVSGNACCHPFRDGMAATVEVCSNGFLGPHCAAFGCLCASATMSGRRRAVVVGIVVVGLQQRRIVGAPASTARTWRTELLRDSRARCEAPTSWGCGIAAIRAGGSVGCVALRKHTPVRSSRLGNFRVLLWRKRIAARAQRCARCTDGRFASLQSGMVCFVAIATLISIEAV